MTFWAQGLPDQVDIADIRSVWAAPLRIPIGDRVTVLVGPNRSGTTAVLFAMAASVDASIGFLAERDLPFGRAPALLRPQVTWSSSTAPAAGADAGSADGATTERDAGRVTVTWDLDGTRHSPSTAGTAVYCPVERTTAELVAAARLIDVGGGAHLDDDERLSLADAVLDVAHRVVPEVVAVEVPREVGLPVVLRDDRGAALAEPQARALVALGSAIHLGQRGQGPDLVAIEAPDALLHPAAQRRLGRVLTSVAERTGAVVVVATTSPFVVPRTSSTMVAALARDGSGRTHLVGAELGDRPQAALLGGLVDDAGFAAVLDRTARIEAGVDAVLVVEGGTDEAYLRLVADKAGVTSLFDRVDIWPAGGAMGAALTAIVLRAETATPVMVLLDHDDAGRRARDTLVSRFGFLRSLHVMTYADVFDGVPVGVEAETLFDLDMMRAFVADQPASVSDGERREHGVMTVELTPAGKSVFVDWLRAHLTAEMLGAWPDLFTLIGERLDALRTPPDDQPPSRSESMIADVDVAQSTTTPE